MDHIATLAGANVVADDLRGVMRRLIKYLIILVLGVLYMLVIEIYYIASKSDFNESKKAWIDCVSDAIESSSGDEYTIEFGDDCHDTLVSDGYIFPSFWVFTGLPIFIAFVYV